eukprot:g12073.t1
MGRRPKGPEEKPTGTPAPGAFSARGARSPRSRAQHVAHANEWALGGGLWCPKLFGWGTLFEDGRERVLPRDRINISQYPDYLEAEDASQPARQTWGAATSDALSKRYSAVANDEKQSAQKREAAMLFAVAEGHINDHEDFEAALQAASQALELFKDLGDIEGVADSLRVVVDAMRLQSAKKDEKPEEALRLASEELVWFREEGHKRGQASMLLALARVNSSGRRGTKDREQGIRQAKEAVKIYRELGDKAMEGAVLMALVDLYCYVKSFQEAIGAANKALVIFEDLGDSRSEARATHLLAEARFGNRQMEGGAQLTLRDETDRSQAAEDAIALWQELGMKRQEAIELLTVAQWHVEEDGVLAYASDEDEAQAKYQVSSWGTWGCEVSKFDWQYSGTETAYVLEGEVTVTPTGDWSSCKATKIEAGDLVVFPDGMTCVWDVTKPIKKHFNFS